MSLARHVCRGVLVLALLSGPLARASTPEGGDAGVRVQQASLAGTRWRFAPQKRVDTPGTLELLPGGVARLTTLGHTSEGRWRQDGRALDLEFGGYTAFHFELDGDRLTGSWWRLAGADQGRRISSTATRVR